MLEKKQKATTKKKSISFLSTPQPPSAPHLIAANGTNVDDIEWSNIDHQRTVSLALPPSKRRRLSLDP